MKTLVVVASRTGNTRLLAHGICDALPQAELVEASDLPEDLTTYDPILLGFWCDRGMTPEDMAAAARRIRGKRIGCFATIGGDPETENAKAWMSRTCSELVNAGGGNTLEVTYMCRGRIDPSVLAELARLTGKEPTPKQKAKWSLSETHPDRLDILEAVRNFAPLCGGPAT